jgi:hypothetical protein
MQPFHARVKNGRLTLDEPSDLPEGQVVVLLPLEDLLTLVDEDGAAAPMPLTFSIEAPPRQWRKPKHVDAAAILDELRSM